MSDISKKIFPIDPAPDEDPIAIVPDMDEDTVSDPQDKAGPHNSHAPENSISWLRKIEDVPEEPAFHPIMHLVKPIEETPREGLLNKLTVTTEPIAESVSFIQEETPEEPPEALEARQKPIVPEPDFAEPEIQKIEPRFALPEKAEEIQPLAFLDSKPQQKAAAPRKSIDWIGPLLALLTGLSVTAMIWMFMTAGTVLTPLNLGIIAGAAIIPMTAVIVLWVALKAFSSAQAEAQKLAEISATLLRADDGVADQISRLSTSIRLELAKVDQKLSQTRNELEMTASVLTKQVADSDGLIRNIGTRSQTIATAAAQQKQSLQDMSTLIDTQTSSLSEKLSDAGKQLSEATVQAATNVERSTEGLKAATAISAEHIEVLAEQTETLLQTHREIEAKITDLTSTYDKRVGQTENLVKRLSTEASEADEALTQQSVHLTSVNSQIESMGSRLTALIDHAKDIQDELSARLSDIDSTLLEADRRSKDFTAGLADRVEDSLSKTRRELSIIEGDVRSLQSRLDDTKLVSEDAIMVSRKKADQPKSVIEEAELVVEKRKTPSRKLQTISHLDLTPIDDTFSDDLSIPQIEETPELDADDDQILTLTQPIEPFEPAKNQPDPGSDIVTRPGNVEKKLSGKPQDKNWRWRDMLGGLDHQASPPSASETRKVERPGPGVPLSPPPAARIHVDGSAIVSRLREVELPPRQTVEDIVIQKAVSARMSGGEDAQSSAMFAHVNAPIIHLRGVLSADTSFRAKAERFRQEYHEAIGIITDSGELLKLLATDSGRAYLLCAAAFFSG